MCALISAGINTQSMMSNNIEKWSHEVIYSTFSFMVMQWLLTERFYSEQKYNTLFT